MGSRDRSRERSRRSRSRERRRSRSRSRDRKRRSRSRDRKRSRSRSRGRGTAGGAASGTGSYADIGAIQAMAAIQQQQQLQRQLLTQQLLMQQQATSVPGLGLVGLTVGAGVAPPSSQADRKAREVYIGNLAIGIVTADMLRELFNAILANMVPDPVTNPPVVEVKMDASGRFGFVELRTKELADVAMQLDKLELCGRQMNVGRPKGYVDNQPGVAQQAAKISMAQMFAAQLSGGATNVVLLENLMSAEGIRNEQERRELYDDVFTEAIKCGSVLGLAIPIPPALIPGTEACRVYIKFTNTDDASKCKQMMDGRQFDDRQVKASFAPEIDFTRAQQGEWIQQAPAMALPGAAPAIPALPTAVNQFMPAF